MRRLLIYASAMIALAMSSAVARAMDYVVMNRDGREIEVAGEILVEAQDGGLLVRSRDGKLWIIQPDELVRRRHDDAEFEPLSDEQIANLLLREMPAGFRIHQTAHYVICYNTSPAYAEWCGGLFERLYRGFYNYWKNRGIKLHDPETPLVALVFSDQRSYAEYAKAEIGEATSAIIGYYNMQSNRVNTYDLTGVAGLQNTRRRNSAAHINQILSQPGAERTVATIVHEATHQLAYNSGLQTRYADNPFWLSEGMAVYFEAPDFGSSKGWRTIGNVNQVALNRFRQALRTRTPGTLVNLISDDKQFRDPQQGPVAYAESWALTYFLIKTRRNQFADYVQKLAKQAPLSEAGPQGRIAQFQSAFGDDLEQLEVEFLRYMQRVR